ncbi:hypothetical protein B0H19DRAFT_1142616 [Mycena capillaripes]|nr:hypothetical protein B0H19DRAFT_1142616 [Mycena capillaripes]
MSVAEHSTDSPAIRRQLNAVRDPVAALPLELSSKIFIYSLPLHPALGSSHIPMLLKNGCTAWSDIAQSARRSHVVSFELVLYCSSELEEPDAEERAAFRQLIADGMNIYIGDSDENFLEAGADE